MFNTKTRTHRALGCKNRVDIRDLRMRIDNAPTFYMHPTIVGRLPSSSRRVDVYIQIAQDLTLKNNIPVGLNTHHLHTICVYFFIFAFSQ